MSAIWGILHTDGKLVSKEVEQSMIKGLSAYKLDSINTWKKDNIHFGCGIQYITQEALHEILPCYDEDKGLAITSDAIIDNREELFRLLDVSVEYQKEITDSELILISYCKWGKDCPKYLIGDFSFVIWDEKKNELFCARDHVGKRTFYYSYVNNTFIFCTVMKPIIRELNKTIELNEKWIADFLSLIGVLHEIEYTETIYKDIYQLAPANTITLENNTINITQYWNPFDVAPLKLKNDKEYEEAFKKVFYEAVQCRLRCCGEVGISLSGGLDSGSVAAVAAKQLLINNKKLRAFSSTPMKGYKDYLPQWRIADESEYIENITNYIGNIDITYCRSEGKDSVSDIDFFLSILEQPYKTIENLFWYNNIAENASKNGCKVLLDGQFGNSTISYGNFYTQAITLFESGKILTLFKEIEEYSRFKNIPKSRINKAIVRATLPYGLRKFVSSRVNKTYDKFRFIPISLELANKWDVIKRLEEKGYYAYPERFYNLTDMKKWNINPVAFSHTAAIETKISLANGIVKRDPTRDKRVIEFCLSLPGNQFVRNGQERYLIRRTMKGILPDKVRLNTSTRGLQSADWIQRLQIKWKDIYNELEQILNNENICKYINVEKLKNELKNMNDSIDEKEQYSVRMLLITMIFYKFILEYKTL